MSRSRCVLLFCVALLVALLALLPLRVALEATDLETSGLFAPRVGGTVWSGRLHEARWRGNVLGDVQLSLVPWSLLRGTLRLDLDGRNLSATMLSGRLNGIRDAGGSLALDHSTATPGLAMTLHLDQATLLFSDGACQQASGRLAADVAFGSTAPIRMQGGIRCGQGNGVITLENPATATGIGIGIRTQFTIDGDGGYRAHSQVNTNDDEAALAWRLAGFRKSPAGLERTDSGQLLH